MPIRGAAALGGGERVGNVSAVEKLEIGEEGLGVKEDEDEVIRKKKAYPGAVNSIGSIYQRRWVLSMDRVASGFRLTTNNEGKKRWVRQQDVEAGGKKDGNKAQREKDEDEVRDNWVAEEGGFKVRGRDVERSILTGRNADEFMRDEGVKGFVGRKGWRAVVE